MIPKFLKTAFAFISARHNKKRKYAPLPVYLMVLLLPIGVSANSGASESSLAAPLQAEIETVSNFAASEEGKRKSGQEQEERSNKRDTSLQQALEELIYDFNGDAGVYVRHLSSGKEFAVHPDTLYPTASMVKVPIMGKLFQDMEEGKLDYRDELPYDTLYSYRFSEDMINRMPAGSLVSVNRLIYLMIGLSDNTSSIWLQDLAGGGAGINAWLSENGWDNIRVNSRTEGRAAYSRMYGWGQATPREMTELMIRIFKGELVSPLASDKMYRILKSNMWDADGLSQVPPYINYASKGGAVRRARSETVVVNAPSGDYAYTVMTKNQEDERYEYDNDGYVLKRMIGRLLWTHFEPKHPWQPHPEYPERF